jgi:hypothetical protein
MSLSDYIKYLRAVRGGATPWEIAEVSGVAAGDIHFLEVKHRRVGEDDEMLQKLASYFEVPIEDLTRRRDAYRKRLTYFLDEHLQSSTPIALKMESGEELEGNIAWYSREAVALSQDEAGTDLYIVQRAWVSDWRDAEQPAWDVASQAVAV